MINNNTVQPPSSSKREAYNKLSIFEGVPVVAKIWAFKLSGKLERCII